MLCYVQIQIFLIPRNLTLNFLIKMFDSSRKQKTTEEDSIPYKENAQLIVDYELELDHLPTSRNKPELELNTLEMFTKKPSFLSICKFIWVRGQ